MRALIIEKRVQNLNRLTTCSSYTKRGTSHSPIFKEGGNTNNPQPAGRHRPGVRSRANYDTISTSGLPLHTTQLPHFRLLLLYGGSCRRVTACPCSTNPPGTLPRGLDRSLFLLISRARLVYPRRHGSH